MYRDRAVAQAVGVEYCLGESRSREHGGDCSPVNGRAEENEAFNGFVLLSLCLKGKMHLTFVAILPFHFASQSQNRLCVEGRKRNDLRNVRIIMNGRS